MSSPAPTRAPFDVVPAFRCYAPARAFRNAQEARRWARAAAARHRVPFDLWASHNGRGRLLERFEPPGGRDHAEE